MKFNVFQIRDNEQLWFKQREMPTTWKAMPRVWCVVPCCELAKTTWTCQKALLWSQHTFLLPSNYVIARRATFTMSSHGDFSSRLIRVLLAELIGAAMSYGRGYPRKIPGNAICCSDCQNHQQNRLSPAGYHTVPVLMSQSCFPTAT
jgi:hypothetical protein